MCIGQVGKWFGGGDNGLAAQQLQIAQQQQQEAAAAVANSKGDTQASRTAAENEMRKAGAASGFASTVLGSGGGSGNVAFKALFGG